MVKNLLSAVTRITLVVLAGIVASPAFALTTTMARVAMFFDSYYDANHDGRIDRVEWTGRGNFDLLDANHDGGLDLDEFSAIYETAAVPVPMHPITPDENPMMDTSIVTFQIKESELGEYSRCAISRLLDCEDGTELARQRGLIETGLTPLFPEGARCQGVDEAFAMSYTRKAGRDASHGGIDIPAAFDVPILAAAAGTIVGIFNAEEGLARGRTLVLRHSPEDTGFPFWTYTEYAHLNDMPKQVVGQRVRMGEVIGPTGNSGHSVGKPGGPPSKLRRPGIHFAVYYAKGPRYAVTRSYVVPEDGRWMDPNAFYRKTPPYDSEAVKALPEADKFIPIPIMFADGESNPTGSKLIWPYPCKRIP